jgi:hypothetical protein
VRFRFRIAFVIVTALQNNRTLKKLELQRYLYPTSQLTDDEGKQMAALLKKNYGLESLPDINLEKQARDLGAKLRLNRAGRRYIIEDGSSISKGVEVLIRVINDINCVFLHMLENPRLCDRGAAEVASDSTVRSRDARLRVHDTTTTGSCAGEVRPSLGKQYYVLVLAKCSTG